MKAGGTRRIAISIVAAEVAVVAASLLLGHAWVGVVLAAGTLFIAAALYRPMWAWVLVWLTYPFSIEVTVPGLGALFAPTEPMMAAALAVWIARWLLDRPIRFPRGRLDAPLAVLAGVVLLASALGPFPMISLKGWIIAGAYAAFGYAVCAASWTDHRRAERLYPWTVGLAAAFGLFGAIRVVVEGATLSNAYRAAYPFFPEHGSYSAYLAMFLPLTLLLALERRGSARWGYVAAGVAMSLGIAMSFTRAAWVSLAVVLPLMAVVWSWRRRSRKPVLYMAGIMVLVGAFLTSTGAFEKVSTHAETITAQGDVSNIERLNRWIAAVDMVRARPWLGFGYAAYPFVYPEFRHKTLLTSLAYQHMGPHSELLRIVSETGLVGLVAVAWMVAAVFVVGWRVVRDAPDPHASLLALAVLAGLGTYGIHALFRTYIDLEKVAVPLWTSFGVIAGMARSREGSAA